MIDSAEARTAGAAGAAGAARRPSPISVRTWAISGVLVALLVAFYYYNVQAYWNESLSDFAFNVVYVWGISFAPVAAGLAFWTAYSFAPGDALRRVWILMGLGMAAYATGDIIWTWLELVMGVDPYPSIADFFYMLQYPLFVAAITLAVAGYRRIADIKRATIIGSLVGAAALAVVYTALLQPYIFPYAEELGLVGTFVSAAYPVFDVAFLAVPALVLALVARSLGTGRFGWPWWLVAGSAFVFAATDGYYSYVDWSGLDYPAILDIGWAGSAVLIGIAALVARDVCCSD